jgi:uncharacterized protein YjbI with pentapeptide repeats
LTRAALTRVDLTGADLTRADLTENLNFHLEFRQAERFMHNYIFLDERVLF